MLLMRWRIIHSMNAGVWTVTTIRETVLILVSKPKENIRCVSLNSVFSVDIIVGFLPLYKFLYLIFKMDSQIKPNYETLVIH
jgi:hypothetical protein